MAKAHPGFGAVQSKIAGKQGISKDRAGAILAASSRNASPAAKRKNPRLKKVGGERRDLARQLVDNETPKSRKLLPKSRLKGGQK